MPKLDPTTVLNIPAFQKISAKTKQELASAGDCSTFRPGEPVINHLNNDDAVYFLIQGHAKVIIYSESGKIVSFREIRNDEFVGELAAIDGGPRTANVEAISNCIFFRLPAKHFQILMNTEASFASYMCHHLTQQIREMTLRIYEYSTAPVSRRVQLELLRLAREGIVDGNSAAISSPPKHADIASRISTHREAVSREFSKLTRTDVIKRKGSTLIIQDLARLEALIDETPNE